MKHAHSEAGRKIVGRLEKGDRLPDALLEVCREHNITAGEIRALGAVTDLQVTEYDVVNQQYRDPIGRKEASEILLLYGNLSYKYDDLFAHLHITASFLEDGATKIIAGHLVSAEVFACEYVIDSFDDLHLERENDEPTKLMLWNDIKKKADY